MRDATNPDLAAIWDAHCEAEFVASDLDGTMRTMVVEPYVNHIPTMMGGLGQEAVRAFYGAHFISRNPADTTLTPISRTIGPSSLVDEMLFSFTHTSPIDWMLPGVEPTGRYVEVPLIAIVHFEGDKVAHEHIYWDQASVLVQVGLLDADALPVTGIEAARKLADPSLPSNTLFRTRRGI